MLTIKTQGLDALIDGLQAIPRALQYAIPNYQNSLAFGLKAMTQARIKEVFPTARPQTARNVFVSRASRGNGRAQIWFDQIYRRGVDEYMLPEIEGGARGRKPSESRLGRYWVPGVGARLDQYGNLVGGQMTQILSQLQMFQGGQGWNANATAASRGRKTGSRRTAEYVLIAVPTNGLAPGVYRRVQTSVGFGAKTARKLPPGAWQKSKSGAPIRARGLQPVLVFTRSAPKYQAIWPFFDDTQAWIDDNMGRIADQIIMEEIHKELAYRARKWGG